MTTQKLSLFNAALVKQALFDALKKLHRPRIRAEGTMGGSRVEKPEFDASAPPAIGFIVSSGRASVSLTFDKDVSGDAA